MTDPPAARRPVGRPPQISRERIIEAVAASEDVEVLTVRDLARRLGVSHGALYRWVQNRHALFELISEALLGRVLDDDGPLPTDPRERLGALASRLRDRYLAIPGFASHLARPHHHHAPSIERLHAVVVHAFAEDGVPPDDAERSWLAYISAVVAWIALEDGPAAHRDEARFDGFVGALLRGLPVRSGRREPSQR